MNLFDVSNLTDLQLGHIEFILNSPSYGEVFRPFLEGRRQHAVDLLLDRSENRKKQFSDDMLGERANSIGDFITFCDKIVAETQVERIHLARMAMTGVDQHTAAVASGAIGHSGVSRLDDGYAADEEF